MRRTMLTTVLVFVLALGPVVWAGQATLAGAIVGWGRNDYGQATSPAGNDFVAVAAGEDFSLALKQDGSIVGWGKNNYGQADPPAGNDFVAISAGRYHGSALKADGSIVAWGRNNYGQTDTPAGNNFVAISSKGHHGLALTQEGSIVAWGYNNYGQADPPAGNDYVAIAAGGYHSLALKQDGSIFGWGRNDDGQATPPFGNDYIAIAVGFEHSLALRQVNSIVTWGYGGYGLDSPPAGNNYVAITGGRYHSLTLKQDGSVVGWGDNSTSPDGYDFIAIDAGYWHSLAITIPIGTAFTYQGRLIDSNNPVDGLFDFQFEVYNDANTGSQKGETIYANEVNVIDGYFTVELDFGSDVFIGNRRWLEIGVRPDGSGGFTTLSPRQEVTPTPYAIYANHSLNASDGHPLNAVYVDDQGNVGIGTTNPLGKLDVNGSIYQRGSVLHADYVFGPNYKLESIKEHSEYMWRNKHLPAIPKAKVDGTGKEIVEVGAYRRGIIEELEKAHIYIEQLHKRIKALEQKKEICNESD